MNNNIKRRRKKKETKGYLRSKLALAQLYCAISTVACILLIGLIFIQNNNLNYHLEENEENKRTISEYENKINTMQSTINGYKYVDERLNSTTSTINELINVSCTLDEQNKLLIDKNKELEKDIQKYQTREELYDKYEYAIIHNGERTDIKYDQLVSLEELLKDKNINDADLILSLIMVESEGKEKATNPDSTAKGFGQILDGTSKYVYTNLMKQSGWNPSIALDGDTNIQMVVSYIDKLYSESNEDIYETIYKYRGKQDSSYIASLNKYLARKNKDVTSINL